MAAEKQYDAIVIGSGQGGGPLAHKLADRGWRVAFIEKEQLGGTCINWGCTPTKTMLASARIAHNARRSAEFGIHTGPVEVNLAEVMVRKNAIVGRWREGQEEHAARRPTLTLYRGVARFVAPRTIAVNDARLVSDHIFIDTGGRPRIPDISGLDGIPYLTSRTILELDEVPAHLLVLGGSYIGLEFGQMFRRFGSQVTILEHRSQIAPQEDSDVAATLQEALEAEGIRFCLNARATAVAQNGSELTLTVEDQEGDRRQLAGSHLLIATGRVPNTEALNLEVAGIETDNRGYIKVNGRLETTAQGVWAIGDVKGGPAFTHVSYDDHLVIYDNLINGQARSIEGRIIPYALFTDPELGRVGLTEKAARSAGYRLKVGSIPMEWVARATERGETAGLMKIVINADDDRILGAAILSTAGGELVQTLMVLMMVDAPWTVLHKGMFIHPTLTEGFFSLMDNVKLVEPEQIGERRHSQLHL